MRDRGRGQFALWLLVGLVVVAMSAAVFINHWRNVGNSTFQQNVNWVASQLRAPGDPSTVATSSLGNAQNMRFEIEQDLRQGMSTQQVLSQMIQEYGSGVLAVPQFRGFGQLAWVMPWVVISVIGFGIVLFLRRTVRVEPQRDNSLAVQVWPGDDSRHSTSSPQAVTPVVDSQLSERLQDYL